jgi:glycosyltransferase involved in cell wall biosynthesis
LHFVTVGHVRLLIVIPALNEQKTLGSLLEEIEAARRQIPHTVDAVVIDDGSTDGTSAIAAQHGCRVVRLCGNLGIGGAVQTGLRLAFAEGFDCAVQIDADGQHPPDQIGRLLADLDAAPAADLVVGSRRLKFEGYQSTVLRRLGQAWLRSWLHLVCRLRVTDPTSGFRLYGPRALDLFQRSYPYDYPEPESLALARACGLSIAETAVEMRARQGGRSSIAGLRSLYYVAKVTLAIGLVYARSRTAGRRDAENDSAAGLDARESRGRVQSGG